MTATEPSTAPPIDLSVVVPVYNSAAIVEELAHRLTETLEALDRDWEVILVNDGSTDDVWERMTALHARDGRFKIVDLARNFGQHNATLCGLRLARGAVVVTMDDDLQADPADLPTLLAELDEGHDVVTAAYPVKRHGPLRNLGSALHRRVKAHLFQLDPHLRTSTFRAIRRPVIDELCTLTTPSPILGGMLLTVTSRVASVELAHHERFAGSSGYTFGRSLRLALNLLINYSALPLVLVSVLGLLVASLAFLFGLGVLARKLLFDIPVEGWTTLIILVAFLGGLNLVATSIVGTYISRLLRETGAGKQYVVRETRL